MNKLTPLIGSVLAVLLLAGCAYGNDHYDRRDSAGDYHNSDWHHDGPASDGEHDR